MTPEARSRGTVVRDEYLRAGDVARLLHVSPKTVARWATEGKLPYVRTLGGHRRFSGPHIQELGDRLALRSRSEGPPPQALHQAVNRIRLYAARTSPPPAPPAQTGRSRRRRTL